MAMKIISKSEYEPFEIEYVVKYDIIVGTPETSAAKTYENQIEMMVTMEIPKSQFKNENIIRLVKWGKLSVTNENYYRDLAIEVTIMDNNKRSIVFSHAYINLNIIVETQKNYIIIEILVKQKVDKYVGVMFGTNLEKTYEKVKNKITNLPNKNIVIP